MAGVQQSRVELGRHSDAAAAVEVAACSFGARMEEDAPLLVRSGGLTGEVCLLHWWKIHRPLLRTRQPLETSLAEILAVRARSKCLVARSQVLLESVGLESPFMCQDFECTNDA